MKRGGRLRAFSVKRRREQRERSEVARRVRERDVSCRAAVLVLSVECGGDLDVHEVIPRSVWRLGYLDVDNCMLVCRRHHDWIDDHLAEAREVGLHGMSWERPVAVAVRFGSSS